MITGIKQINLISKIQQGRVYTSPAFKGSEADTFEVNCPQIKEKLSYAKSKITDSLKRDGKEYMVIVNPDGSIHEQQGDADTCSIPYSCIEKGAISMHGHPKLLPLSSGDIAGLLASNCISTEAITVDGKYSKLTKRTQSDFSPKDYNKLYKKFEKELCLMALDKMGIDYHYSKEDIIKLCSEIIPSVQTKSFEETVEFMHQIGQSLSGTPDEMAEQLKNGILSFKILYDTERKYDKAHNTIMANYDAIKDYLNTEEGVAVRNELVKKIADDYNLEYETNMF